MNRLRALRSAGLRSSCRLQGFVKGATLATVAFAAQQIFGVGEMRFQEAEDSRYQVYFSPEAIGFEIKDFKDVLESGEEIQLDGDYLVFLDPFIFNENFLREVQQIVLSAMQTAPKLKVYVLSKSSLTPEQAEKLQTLTLGQPIPKETLFIMKRAQQTSFDCLSFDTYFQNNAYLNSYFEALKLITAKNYSTFKTYIDGKLKKDQLFVIGVLSPENPDLRAKQILRLRNMKIENPSLNSENIGLVGADVSLEDWAQGVAPGDLLLLQPAHYSKIVGPSDIDRKSHFFTVVKQGVSLPSDDLSLAIAKAYGSTNIFFHPDMLEASAATFLVKIRVDLNRQTGRSLKELHHKVRSYRRALEKLEPAIAASTVFLLDRVALKDDGYEVLVSDVKRGDMKTMYSDIT